MVWAALAAAAVTAAASYISSSQSNAARRDQANSANAVSALMQQNQIQAAYNIHESNQRFQVESDARAREFSEYMSGTAYQRAMGDMRAAGLNPMLAYQQGGASSNPASGPGAGGGSVSAGSGQQATVEQVLGPAVSAAFQTANVMTGLEQMEANTANLRQAERTSEAQEGRTRAETLLRAAEEARTNADAERLRNSAVTEALRPGQVSAETALAGERTRTQREETGRVAAERSRSEQEAEEFRRHGRPGLVGSAGSSAERLADRMTEGVRGPVEGAGAAVGRALGRAWYGGRNAPSGGNPVDSILRFLW